MLGGVRIDIGGRHQDVRKRLRDVSDAYGIIVFLPNLFILPQGVPVILSQHFRTKFGNIKVI